MSDSIKKVTISIGVSNLTQAGLEEVRKALESLAGTSDTLNQKILAGMKAVQTGSPAAAQGVEDIVSAVRDATLATDQWGAMTVQALSKLGPELQGLRGALEQMHVAIDLNSVKSRVGLDSIAASLAKLPAGAKAAAAAMDSMGAVGGKIKQMLGQAGLGFGVVQLGRAIVEAGEAAENAQVQLTSLQQSAELARDTIRTSLASAQAGGFGSEAILAADSAIAKFSVSVSRVLPIAMAFAAATGKDVAGAAQAAALAFEGNTRGVNALMRQYGISAQRLEEFGARLDSHGKVAVKTQADIDALRSAMEKLAQTDMGSAVERQAHSMKGSITAAKDSLFDLLTVMANQLEPTVVEVAGTVKDLAGWMHDLHIADLLILPGLINMATEEKRFRDINEQTIESVSKATREIRQLNTVLQELAVTQGKVSQTSSNVPQAMANILDVIQGAKPTDILAVLKKNYGIEDASQIDQQATATGEQYNASRGEMAAIKQLIDRHRGQSGATPVDFSEADAGNQRILEQRFKGFSGLPLDKLLDQYKSLETQTGALAEKTAALNAAGLKVDPWAKSLSDVADQAKAANTQLATMRQLTGKDDVAGDLALAQHTTNALRNSIQAGGQKTDNASLGSYMKQHGDDANDPMAANIRLYAAGMVKVRDLQKQSISDNVKYWQDLAADDEAAGNNSLQRKAMYLDQEAAAAKGNADLLRTIHREQVSNDAAIVREQDKNARQATEDLVHDFQEKERLAAEDIKAQVATHRLSEAEAARHYTELAAQVDAFRAAHPELATTEYGKGLDRGLQSQSAGLGLQSAEATKADQTQTDSGLAKHVRDGLEQSKILHHNAFEAQLADLETLRAYITASAATEEVKTHELMGLDKERATLQDQHDKERASAIEHIATLEEKIQTLQVRKLEKDFNTPGGKTDETALAAAIQKQTDMELAAIETKRQKAIAANGDVASANADAAAAQMELYAQQGDAIDSLMQKQEAMAEKEAKKEAKKWDKSMSLDEAVKGLNEDTQSRWYGPGTGLSGAFSLSMPSQAKDTSQLGQLKSTYDRFGQSTGAFASAVKMFQDTVGGKAGASSGSSGPAGGPASAGDSGQPLYTVRNGVLGPNDGAANGTPNVPGSPKTGETPAPAGDHYEITNTFHINTKVDSGSSQMGDRANEMAALALQWQQGNGGAI